MTYRTVFMGTAEIACTPLRALCEMEGIELSGVLTQPDKPSGRKLRLQSSPVKQTAEKLGLQIFQPENLRDQSALKLLSELQPNLFVVMAYGQILPKAVLDLPSYGALNLHASLLPRHRGAAPIQRALLEGDSETGITLMQMAPSLDTGDMIAKISTPIHATDTSETLLDRLAGLSGTILLESLMNYLAGKITPIPQDDTAATYAWKVTKEEGQVDWLQSATHIHRQIRAFTPWPGAFFTIPSPSVTRARIHEATPSDGEGAPGEVLIVDPNRLRIGCGQGTLDISILQKQGGRPMSVRDFLNGHTVQVGDRFI